MGEAQQRPKGPVRVTLVSACYKEVGHCGNPHIGNCTGYNREKKPVQELQFGEEQKSERILLEMPVFKIWQVTPNGVERTFMSPVKELVTFKSRQRRMLT